MLIGIDPILSPDLLWTLRAMGHGEEIAIVDGNFPGEGYGARCLRADGHSATDVLRAVLSLMPLDDFVDDPVAVMQVVGAPDEVPPVIQDFQAIVNAVADHPAEAVRMERFAFYDRAKAAHAVVQTGEARLYGNIILKKGVVRP
ncbi:MAG: RbsD/FucU family protein [Pseudomonadota bacterium]